MMVSIQNNNKKDFGEMYMKCSLHWCFREPSMVAAQLMTSQSWGDALYLSYRGMPAFARACTLLSLHCATTVSLPILRWKTELSTISKQNYAARIEVKWDALCQVLSWESK